MNDFTSGAGLLGGILIGSASGLLLLSSGQIAGISGILGGALARPSQGASWRWAFLAGMSSSGAVLAWLWGERRHWLVVLVAAATTAALWAVFVRGFGIPLPKGVFG